MDEKLQTNESTLVSLLKPFLVFRYPWAPDSFFWDTIQWIPLQITELIVLFEYFLLANLLSKEGRSVGFPVENTKKYVLSQ